METGAAIGTAAAGGAAAGMAFGPIGAGVGAVVGALAGLWGGLAAAAEKRRQVEESLRRNRLQQAQTMGRGTAVAAASGVEMDSGSLTTYFQAMQDEFKRQNEWTQSSGDAAANNMALAGGLTMVADLGRGLSNVAQLNNYWRSPTFGPTPGDQEGS
jgi:hypothetical protein